MPELKQILDSRRIAEMVSSGLWADCTLASYFADAIAATPDKIAIVEHRVETGARTVLTFAQLDAQVDKISAALLDAGVGIGEVISYQLPNWWQFTALHLAALRIGAITNPLMPIFRERELKFMVGLAESKVLVVPKLFRGFDYARMAEDLRPELPSLRRIMVVDLDPELDASVAPTDAQREQARRAAAQHRSDANDVVQILYTSGTTGEPKGVMHTSNTLLAHLKVSGRRLGIHSEDVILCSTPLAHQLGFMYGIILPLLVGASVVFQDVWNAGVAARLIEDDKVTFMAGATPFLADLTDLPDLADFDVSTLRLFFSAGAPIPRSLVHRATERLGAKIISAWGMTENGAPTIAKPEDDDDKVFNTDGCVVEGMEIRIVDDSGAAVAPGSEGRLQVRGASNFVGYLKRPELYGIGEDGWFDTGDLAKLDEDGYIRISGRSKDVIIRGGENIPVVEVENVLYRHPAVAAVAIVAMPDARLGERACAYVQLRPGERLTLEELRSFLTAEKMARHYFPERLEIVGELPRTPSGKIQKFKLRDQAKFLSA